MSKRLTVVLDSEADELFEKLLIEANEGFDAGRITASDLLSEIIISTKIDMRALQLKHSDLRKSLKALSKREEIDIETAIRILSEMKGRVAKKKPDAAKGGAEC